MFVRVLIAAAGALLVTGALLLAMDSVTSLFENRSGERYFRISDVLPKPEAGRPERPAAAARQPATVEPDAVSPDAVLPIETPLIIETRSPTLLEPEIARPPPPTE